MPHLQPAGLPSGTIGARRPTPSVLFAPLWRTSASQAALALATLVAAVLVPWWAATQLLQAYGHEVHGVVGSGTARWLLAAFGLLPLLLTAVALAVLPRWTQATAAEAHTATVAARPVATPLWLLLTAAPVTLLGVHAHTALMALGLGLGALGMALVAGRSLVKLLDGQHADSDHARAVVWGLGGAALAQWVAAVALALHAPTVAEAAAQAALWSAALVLSTVALRQMPRFAADRLPSQAAWRPRALLAVLSLLLRLELLLTLAQSLAGGGLPVAAALTAAGVEAAASVLLCWLSLRWGLRASLRRQAEAFDADGEPIWARAGSLRLLAMGQVGFAGLALTLGLQAVSHLLLGLSDAHLSLGAAPLLALALTSLAPLALALATRETLRHAHAPLCADRWSAMLSAVLVLGGLFAVLAALFPANGPALNLLALQFVGLATLTWAARQRRRSAAG